MRAGWAAKAIGLLGALSCTGAEDAGQEPALVMMEVARVSISASFQIVGAAPASGNAVLLWSTNELLWADPHGGVRITRLDQGQIAGAWRDPRDVGIVVVSRQGTKTIVAGSQTSMEKWGAVGKDEVLAARYLECGVHLLKAHEEGLRSVERRGASGVSEWSISDDSVAAQLQVGGRDSALLVWEAEVPYRVWEWKCGDEVASRLPIDFGGDLAAELNHWRLLAVEKIEGGYLTSIVDLMSDRRILVVHDWTGARLRSTTLDAPVTVLTSTHAGQLVLSRDLGEEREVAWYDVAVSVPEGRSPW